MKVFKKIGISLVPIAIVTGSLATYFAVARKEKKINRNSIHIKTPVQESFEEVKDIYQGVKIFPEIDNNQFYSYLRMKEDSNQPIINNDMVSYIAKYIIKNMNIKSGKISWGVKRKSDSDVDIQIKWIHNYKGKDFTYTHTYAFSSINNI